MLSKLVFNFNLRRYLKAALDAGRPLTPEERFFFQNARLLVQSSGRKNNMAFSSWDRFCSIMSRNYDLTPAGGRSYMRRRRDLQKWTADLLGPLYAECDAALLAKHGEQLQEEGPVGA
jgi:hypothetical protein